MHEDTFTGLASRHLYERLPIEARADFLRIGRGMEHGAEWRWIGGAEVYTEKGLGVLADELEKLNHKAAALVIRRELKAALDAVKARSTPAAVSAGGHETDVLAARWDLKGDNL